MKHVDALSRYAVMVIGEDSIIPRIQRSQQEDADLKAIFTILQNQHTHDDYFIKSGVLYKMKNDEELIVVPQNMQRQIIRDAHERGHFGVKKTKELVSKEFFIPKIDEKIQKHIANCIQCIIVNRKQGKQEGELHPLRKEEVPLHTYHIDFLGPLETTCKQYKYFFAVIDAFTKFSWIYPTKSTTSNDAISKLRAQSTIFGNPNQIISDRGSAFTSEDFLKYCNEENIKHIKITTGLPRANRQIERLNSTIVTVLSKLTVEEPSKWYKHVDKLQQVLISTYCRSLNTTPCELLIGTKMRTKEDLQIKKLIENETVTQFNDDRCQMRQKAKQQILKVQNENRKTYNLR